MYVYPMVRTMCHQKEKDNTSPEVKEATTAFFIFLFLPYFFYFFFVFTRLPIVHCSVSFIEKLEECVAFPFFLFSQLNDLLT